MRTKSPMTRSGLTVGSVLLCHLFLCGCGDILASSFHETKAGTVVVVDAGIDASKFAFGNDAGLIFLPVAGMYRANGGKRDLLIFSSESDRQRVCDGGWPLHSFIWLVLSTADSPDWVYTLSNGGVQRMSFHASDGGVLVAGDGTVVLEGPASPLIGTFSASDLFVEDGPGSGGSYGGAFELSECHSYHGSGDNSVNGALGFGVASATLIRFGNEFRVLLSTHDVQSSCAPAIKTGERVRNALISFAPVDSDSPGGAYDIATREAFISIETIESGTTVARNSGQFGIINVTSGDGGFVRGEYSATLTSSRTGISSSVVGSFSASLCR